MLRWTIGDTTITSIVESETPTSPRYLYHDMGKADALARAERAPWLRPDFVSDDGYLRQKIQCLIIDTGESRVAVDTCVGNDKERTNPMWSGLDGPFLETMTEAGYPPEDITHVVCTHLHVDHVGWNTRLVDGAWVPTFPNARYLFVTTEYEHWRMEKGLFDGEDPFGDSVEPVVAAGQADMVGPDHRIDDVVRLEPTPGHTPGHVSVIVEDPERRTQDRQNRDSLPQDSGPEAERAVITGDMAHNPMQLADPDLSSMFDTDPERSRATRRAMFPRWADEQILVIGTHFGSPTAGRLVADGDGFRLVSD